MKKKYSGEMTIEAAIVTPIIMMIIASLMYFSFYLHDAVKLKSVVYHLGNTNIYKVEKEFEKTIGEELKQISLFVMGTNISCEKKTDSYQIHILLDKKKKIKWLNMLLNIRNNKYTIKVEKEMNSEVLSAGRAICDVLKNKKEN